MSTTNSPEGVTRSPVEGGPAPSKAARSEAQREASRRNGACSRGPVRNRHAARRNAVKHGLRSEFLETMPEGLRLDSLAEIQAFTAALRPRDPFEVRCVRQAGMASARLGRLQDAEEEGAEGRVRNALTRWDVDRAKRVSEQAGQIWSRPSSAVPALRATAEGCDYLADQFEDLGALLRANGGWDPFQWSQFLCLLGHKTQPDPQLEPELAELLRHAEITRTDRPAPKGDVDGRAAAAFERRKAESRAVLEEFVADQIAELVDLADELWRTQDGPDRAGAPRRAKFDASEEGKLLLRYLNEAERHLRRALNEFHRHRLRQERDAATAESTDDAATEPDSATEVEATTSPTADVVSPAPNKPEPAAAEASGEPGSVVEPGSDRLDFAGSIDPEGPEPAADDQPDGSSAAA